MDWQRVRTCVGRAEAMGLHCFTHSLLYWRDKCDQSQATPGVVGDLVTSTTLVDGRPLVITGNLLAPLNAAGRTLIHVQGNVSHSIRLHGPAEVVIGGDVSTSVNIIADMRLSMFVGGHFGGSLRCKDSGRIFVEGDMSGEIKTGAPSTHVFVGGNWRGAMQPRGRAALLTLCVDGFLDRTVIDDIAMMHYTSATIYAGRSNAAPGVYGVLDTPEGERSQHFSWIVNSSQVDQSLPDEDGRGDE